MKWLLWTQLALVVASLAVMVIGMSTSRFGGMLALAGGGLVPILLIAGSVMGLVALKRKKGHIRAGIVLLTPLALAVPSAFGETYEEDAGAPAGVAEDITRTLQWLNWSLWLTAAAAVLAVVSALLLFKRRES